jgi:hypothetical protein
VQTWANVVRERQILTRAQGCGARLSRCGEGLEAGERRDGEGWDGMKRKAPAGQHLPQGSWPGPCGLRVGLVCSHWCQGHAHRHADAGCGLAGVRASLAQRPSVLARDRSAVGGSRIAHAGRLAATPSSIAVLSTAAGRPGPAGRQLLLCTCARWAACQRAAHYQTTLIPLGLAASSHWSGLAA